MTVGGSMARAGNSYVRFCWHSFQTVLIWVLVSGSLDRWLGWLMHPSDLPIATRDPKARSRCPSCSADLFDGVASEFSRCLVEQMVGRWLSVLKEGVVGLGGQVLFPSVYCCRAVLQFQSIHLLHAPSKPHDCRPHTPMKQVPHLESTMPVEPMLKCNNKAVPIAPGNSAAEGNGSYLIQMVLSGCPGIY